MKISSVYALRLQLLLSVEKLLRVSPVREREQTCQTPKHTLTHSTQTVPKLSVFITKLRQGYSRQVEQTSQPYLLPSPAVCVQLRLARNYQTLLCTINTAACV